jgi:hypothetical protein
MDFIVGLPKSCNNSVIMVVVDRLSKYAYFCALQNPFTPSTMAQIFMGNIFKLHGMPHSIFFYHDPTFTNNFWQELLRLQGTQLHLNTTYHPHIDGQIEAIIKGLETYLRCFVFDRQTQWVQCLPLAKCVRQHRYSNRGRTPSVTTHITRSKINTPMFSRGKTPTGKHPRPQPTRPLGAVY